MTGEVVGTALGAPIRPEPAAGTPLSDCTRDGQRPLYHPLAFGSGLSLHERIRELLVRNVLRTRPLVFSGGRWHGLPVRDVSHHPSEGDR